MIPYLHADPLVCVGCRLCEMYCSVTKAGVFNPRKSRVRNLRIEPVTDFIVACRHCAEPLCAEACPVNAITRNGNLVSVDPKLCVGCSACQEACPFGAMFMDPDTNKAIICDRCGDCVPHCPVDTLEISPAESIAMEKRLAYAKNFEVKI